MKASTIPPILILCLMCTFSANCQEESVGPVTEVQVTTSRGTTRIIAKPKSVMISTLSERRQKLEKIVAEAAANGSLTAALQSELKADLARIAGEEEAAASQATKSANSKVMGIARELDDVAFKLNHALHKEVVSPLVQGTQFAINSGDWIDIDDVAMRRWDLEGRIAKLVAEGRTTNETAAELRKALDTIGEKESTMRADGDLDLKESRILYGDFDHVASQIDRLSHGRPLQK